MSKHYIIPIFVPHLGCPHDCIFCNQRKIASSLEDITERDIRDTIERYLSYFKKDSFIEIAFYGGSFTAIDIEKQKSFLNIALEYKNKGIVDEIRLSTRPDAINDLILIHLENYKVDTIELGVQSLCDDVLYKSGRGHNSKDVYQAVKLIRNYNFKLGLQMMIGLPGDTFERSLFTARKFIDLKPECVRIYPTLVIKDTALESLRSENKYSPLTLDKAVQLCTYLLVEFYTNYINVIRVGLQPTENIQLGKDVVDGPFHPAFKQLVESNIFKIVLSSYIDSTNIETNGKVLKIYSNSKNISDIAGQKSKNIDFLKSNYNFKDIKIYSKKMFKNIIDIEMESCFASINIFNEMKKIKRK